MKNTFLLLALILLTSSPAVAANLFVGPAANCNGNGSSWSECASWSSVSFARGNTYYLMDGTYAGKTLSTAENGASPITIKKATPGDFGGGSLPSGISVTGQAVFSSGFTFDTSYWTLDGVRGSWSLNPNDYGFKFADGITYNLFVSKYHAIVTNLTFSHLAAKAPTNDQEKPFFRAYTQVYQVKNLTMSDCLIDGYQAGMQSAGEGNLTSDYWTLERSVLLNGYSRNAGSLQFHGEWINADGKQLTNLVVRYNLFKGADGGMTGTIVANNSTLSGAVVYGNVFDGVSVTNGIISGTSAGKLNSAQVYHNTFLNVTSNTPWVNGGQAGGTGNIAKNNLVYGMTAVLGTGTTSDYNAYFNTTNTPNETNRQIGSGNPFASMTTYSLAAQTEAADTSVPIQYRTDRFGMSGSTRGAVQFNGSGATVPGAPSGLKVQ